MTGGGCIETRSTFDLSGKVAIVTGAGGGIGEQLARGLAEAGCSVVLGGRRLAACRAVAEDITRSGGRAQAVRCDVRKLDDVRHLVGVSTQIDGRIDILVNNAAVIGKEAPITAVGDDDWAEILDTNLKGPFLCCREVAPIMTSAGGGKIINVASIAGISGMPLVSPYCASKGGLILFTKSLALEFAQHNVQVNAICPGHFDTPMSDSLYDRRTWEKVVEAKVPLRRMGRPEELKATAVYLASSGSDFMTGQTIVVDGGQLAWA